MWARAAVAAALAIVVLTGAHAETSARDNPFHTYAAAGAVPRLGGANKTSVAMERCSTAEYKIQATFRAGVDDDVWNQDLKFEDRQSAEFWCTLPDMFETAPWVISKGHIGPGHEPFVSSLNTECICPTSNLLCKIMVGLLDTKSRMNSALRWMGIDIDYLTDDEDLRSSRSVKNALAHDGFKWGPVEVAVTL